ncbi:MBL fold metallo-hydrolase, partial [Jeotgalibaca porci]
AVLALEKHLDPKQLDAVIVTHYHPDHIADMGVLQHVFQLKDPDKTLPIYGHVESDLHGLRESAYTTAVDYTGNEPITIGPFRIAFLKTLHPVPCYALGIVEVSTGKKLVFTADSGYLADFVSFSKDADVLLADTNFFQGQERHKVHMTSYEVGSIAKEANVQKLILTHLPPSGEWEKLLGEAKEAAGDVVVQLAEKDLQIII